MLQGAKPNGGSGSSSSNMGAIVAGITVPAVIIIIVLGLLLVYYYNKAKNKNKTDSGALGGEDVIDGRLLLHSTHFSVLKHWNETLANATTKRTRSHSGS